MTSSRRQSGGDTPNSSMNRSRLSFSPDQTPSLFPEPSFTPGEFNDDAIVRGVVTETIRQCRKSREQIADEMTTLLGERVTLRMLNSYTSEAAEKHRWPTCFTRAFCHTTDDWRLLRCIAERANFYLIDHEQAQLMELGRQYLIRQRASDSIAALEKRLGGIEL